MSRTGYVITYAGCPLLCCSRLQTGIDLSTTEVEYIALSQVMQRVIPFTALIKEGYFIFDIHILNPEVFCKLFEDNQRLYFFRGI